MNGTVNKTKWLNIVKTLVTWHCVTSEVFTILYNFKYCSTLQVLTQLNFDRGYELLYSY